jgi:hypothetical protein
MLSKKRLTELRRIEREAQLNLFDQKEETMTKYQVRKIEVTQFGANSDYIPLKFDFVEKCYDLISLAGDELKDWEIISTNGGLNEEVIDRSPAYKALLLKEADDRATWIKDQNKKTAAINRLSEKFESNLNLPVKLTYVRSNAEFNPTISRTIRWYLYASIENYHSFYPENYVTKTGQVQVKKFADDLRMLFREKAPEVRPEIIRDIVSEYNNLKAKIRNA